MSEGLGRDYLPLLAIDETVRVTGSPLFGRTKVTKLVFLLQRAQPGLAAALMGSSPPFAFVPFYYGPFSKELLESLEELAHRGYIRTVVRNLDRAGRVVEHVYEPTPLGSQALSKAPAKQSVVREARVFLDQYVRMGRFELVDQVHASYPDYIGPRP
jgi:hypothetical protein